MKKAIAFFSFASMLISGLSNIAWAQEQETAGLKVQPALIEERIDPGFTYSSVLRATNLGGETKSFYVIQRNISGISPTGSPIFAEVGEETGFEITSWIKVTEESVTIQAGQTKEIPFSIEVPQNASPGGHFGGIFLSLAPERPTETGIGVGYQVGTIINLRISGDVLEGATMREFRTDRAIYSKPKVTFITRVENIGNVLIRPRGPLEIVDFFGKKVETLRMNDLGSAVLPQQTRQFEIIWEGEGLVFGRYQALLGLVYGDDERKNISGTLSFWVLPLNLILSIAGGILGLLLAIFLFVKLLVWRKVREFRKFSQSAITGDHSRRMRREVLRPEKNVSFSRLALITTVMLVFTMFFLVVLFFFFA